MRDSGGWLLLLLVGPLSTLAIAAQDQSIRPKLTYQEAKTWHEEFMQGRPTKAQRLAEMRSLILASPVDARGLNQIYHNFEGRYTIDPTIPGLEKSVLTQLSASKQQAKGYRREVLYAVAYHNDPRFSVVEMNRPLKRTWGNTDADLIVKHHPTGLYGRVEVKDYSLNSQRTNLGKLKIQIDKMSLEGRKTGALQFWMNARPVIPEIQGYAERAGVFVSGNVKTGKTIAPGSISVVDAMNQHEQQYFKANITRASIGAGELAFAAWRLKNSIPEAVADLSEVWDPATRSTQSILRLAEHGSSTFAGAAMTVSGTSLTSARFAGEELQSRLYRVGRVGGIASVAALGLSESFLVTRYVHGGVLDREFWTSQWVLGTTTSGGMLGWGAGLFVTKSPWGAFAGTNFGGYLGNELGTRTARTYYEYKFGELDKAFGRWLYTQYAVK